MKEGISRSEPGNEISSAVGLTSCFENRVMKRIVSFSICTVAWLTMVCEKPMTKPGDMPDSIEVCAATSRTYSGCALQLVALAVYSDGREQDVTTEVRWSLSPGRAGYIDDSGLFTAFTDTVGTEVVCADFQGCQDTLAITIDWGAQTLAVWPVSAVVHSGGKVQFEAIAKYYGMYPDHSSSKGYVTRETAWSVLPGLAGSIDSTGLFSAFPDGQGREVITGTYHSLNVSSAVTVTPNVELPFEMVTIPAGSFRMGDNNGNYDEGPEHDVSTKAFEIGRYEITNTQYADYLNAALRAGEIFVDTYSVISRRGAFSMMIYLRLIGNPIYPNEFFEYFETGEEAPGFRVIQGYGDYPVIRLTWAGAAAFCMFYGLRLPTEAEWEMACRGGKQYEYGTADGSIGHDLANYAGVGGLDTFEGPAPVGTFPPNPYGLYDMCGNAAEYVHDVYAPGYYAVSPSFDPQGPGPQYPSEIEPGEFMCYRGGGWLFGESTCRSAYRGKIKLQEDTSNAPFFGFRVARTVE